MSNIRHFKIFINKFLYIPNLFFLLFFKENNECFILFYFFKENNVCFKSHLSHENSFNVCHVVRDIRYLKVQRKHPKRKMPEHTCVSNIGLF